MRRVKERNEFVVILAAIANPPRSLLGTRSGIDVSGLPWVTHGGGYPTENPATHSKLLVRCGCNLMREISVSQFWMKYVFFGKYVCFGKGFEMT